MKPYPFCSLNHFTVPVAIGCPFTAGCMNAAPQRGRRLDCRSSGRGSLNVRPAVRSEAAQSSGQRSMDEEYTPPRRCSTARRTAGPSGMVQSGLMLVEVDVHDVRALGHSSLRRGHRLFLGVVGWKLLLVLDRAVDGFNRRLQISWPPSRAVTLERSAHSRLPRAPSARP